MSSDHTSSDHTSSGAFSASPPDAVPAENLAATSAAVAKLYDTYPFPPEPFLDEPPPGYNWRWYWPSAYSFCTGQLPSSDAVRILDAGCGTGVGTEYLVHLNPDARVVGVDLSGGALAIAQERCRRSGGADRVQFHHLSLFDIDQIEGEFDLINCVGVLHHTPDPIGGIQALAKKLKPGGIFHVFVYAALGRWEISLMQQAIALLQGDKKGDYRDGVAVGRALFGALPEDNRIVARDRERWSLENHQDECFADMYVHPQEVDYTVETLFELIDASGLDFVGFSNPAYWSLERLVGKAPDIMARAQGLSEREQYRLIELLDPQLTHYEFFLARPPLPRVNWSDDAALLAAKPRRHPCLSGWPSRSFFNPDYQLTQVSEAEYAFLVACDAHAADGTIQSLLGSLSVPLSEGLAVARSLQLKQLLLLEP